MRLQIFSDIHTDHHRDEGTGFCGGLDASGVDVLIIAGDFVPWTQFSAADTLFEILAAKYPRILYVPGNHEYWGISPDIAVAKWGKLESTHPNVSVLDNAGVEIEGKRFIGGTMWFSEPAKHLKRRWSDYRCIKNFEKPAEGPRTSDDPWVYKNNQNFESLVRTTCEQGDVVISHHLPSYQSVAPKYHGDPTNHFYVHDMETHIETLKPALWVHGHSHHAFDYVLGDTRIVCNPGGYPSEYHTHAAYQEKLIIEV